jgi:hypothetical protein
MSILQTACQYLSEEHWAYWTDEENTAAYFDVAAAAGAVACALVANEEAQCLSLYVQIGVTVPSIKRLRMADFYARVNYELLLGCFELNVETGETHFRAALPLADSQLSRQQLRDLLATSVYTVDRYYPGVMMLIYKNATAAEAVRSCELAK